MEPRHTAHQVAPPPMRTHVLPPPRMGTVTQVRLQPAPQMVSQSHSGMINQMEHARPMQMQYVPQQGMQQIQVQQVQQGAVPANVAFAPQGSVRMVQTIQAQPGQQYVIAQSGQQLGPGVMFLQQANGQSIPVTVGPNGVLQPRIQPAHGAHPLHQLDGNGGLLEDDEDVMDAPCSSKSVARKFSRCTSKKKSATGRFPFLCLPPFCFVLLNGSERILPGY
ncbi:hypothetical protein OESDEN_05677 [Oesophagostomum dentatum]|uniref:Uncharacterized protein n=1 Tax=Oesophagostomum dentatum TaxID=61180 RepID=A0A0B1TA00_OESDE|nr:hypothetical protein OESDEN_05677 [Oesophagostomum dentatum]